MFFHTIDDGAVLGPLEPWHAEEFAAAVVGAYEHLAPWIPTPHVVTDVDTARGYLQRRANEHAADTGHFYGIWLDGTLVGGVLFRVFDAANHTCEIGVWLVPKAEGRGLINRAARPVIDWAFQVRGMRRMAWHTTTTNLRSQAAARRLGFTLEGVLRQAYVHQGEVRDEQVWSLLDHEWADRERAA